MQLDIKRKKLINLYLKAYNIIESTQCSIPFNFMILPNI